MGCVDIYGDCMKTMRLLKTNIWVFGLESRWSQMLVKQNQIWNWLALARDVARAIGKPLTDVATVSNEKAMPAKAGSDQIDSWCRLSSRQGGWITYHFYFYCIIISTLKL